MTLLAEITGKILSRIIELAASMDMKQKNVLLGSTAADLWRITTMFSIFRLELNVDSDQNTGWFTLQTILKVVC